MISFGPIWEARLKELWNDSSLSLSELGRRLGVDPLTVRRHAKRLRLPFSHSGRSIKPLNLENQLKGKHTSTSWEKKRRNHRSKWLSVMKENPKAKLKALRQGFPRVYAWLQQNDYQWLKAHRPKPQRYIRSTSSVDWKKRDAKYAEAVRGAALRLKNAPGRPIQITKTAIGRAIGSVTLLQKKLHKMPFTAQVLVSVIETHIEFATRRIWWAVNTYVEEGILPAVWQLIQRANIYRLRKIVTIKDAIEAAILKLESALPSVQRTHVIS